MKTSIRHVPGTTPHEYQDKTYGKDMRVCNKLPTPAGQATKWRDTVSGIEVTGKAPKKKEEAEEKKGGSK